MKIRTSPAGSHARVGGFTLIELLVVLAIIALLAVALPGFLLRDSEALDLDRATRSIVDSLRSVRSEAIVTNRDQVLSIDVERRQFVEGTSGAPIQLQNGIEINFVTARREQASPSIGRLRFFPDGSSTGGRITLGAADIRSVIDVDWMTGVIAVSSDAR